MNGDHTAAVNRIVADLERQTTAFAEAAHQCTSVAPAAGCESLRAIATGLRPFCRDRGRQPEGLRA